jgi:hypothetical protein
MEDKEISCIQCGQSFFMTAGEQSRLLSRRMDLPKRCPECRRKKSKVYFDNDAWHRKGTKSGRRRDNPYADE